MMPMTENSVYNRQIMEGRYRRYTSMDLNFPAQAPYPFLEKLEIFMKGNCVIWQWFDTLRRLNCLLCYIRHGNNGLRLTPTFTLDQC